MVTYEWKILEWDEKTPNKQKSKLPFLKKLQRHSFQCLDEAVDV